MKNITILLLLTLLFTACTERGYILKPVQTSSKPTNIVVKKQPIVKTSIDKETPSTIKIKEKSIIKPKKIVEITEVIEKNTISPDNNKVATEVKSESFFTFNDETKNKISGFLILLIGIIILL